MKRKVLIIVGGGLFICLIAVFLLGFKLSSSTGTTKKPHKHPGSFRREKPQPSVLVADSTVPLTMLAIGDFGATSYKPGSCCDRNGHPDNTTERFKVDFWAQYTVAQLLKQSARELQPVAVIGHGDNVYYNGVGPEDAVDRMAEVFEDMYDGPELQGIPWFNVVGNHDLGGANFLCGPKDGEFRECNSVEELLKALNMKFQLQADYVSPDNDRWHLRDHYYKETVKTGDTIVEIYNLDTNYADSHGGHQICCQCYGYTKGDSSLINCNTVQKGDQYCAAGDMEMYEACMNQLNEWSKDSMKSLIADLNVSKATFKVINSHYSPHFHMSSDKMKEWYSITKEYGVQLWLNGHTHGFNHDISKWGTHFFENGAGGGIQSETSGNRPPQAKDYITTQWIASGTPYGYMELSFTSAYIKVQWVTFDDQWVFNVDQEKIKIGGIKRGHCWIVPKDLGKGIPCPANEKAE